MGANRDKFIFISGLSKLNDGNGDGCLADMKLLVEKFPQSKLAEMAGMIVNGVKEGRRLHGGKFDLGDVWSRRSVVLNDSDSIAARQLSPDPNANFIFMIAYEPDSVDENKLLFELARYNFTSYMVRNFDIEIEDVEGLSRMQISGFRNFDEALQYARQLYQQQNIVERLGKSRTIIVSEQNLPLLGQQFSYEDYQEFYDEHFAPLKISTAPLLSEPAEIGYEKEPDLIQPSSGEDEEEGEEGTTNEPDADNFLIEDTNNQKAAEEDNNFTIEDANSQQTTQQEDDNTITIEDANTQQPTQQEDDNTITIEDINTQQPAQQVEDNNFVIEDDNKQQDDDAGNIIIEDTNTQQPTPITQEDNNFVIEDDDKQQEEDDDNIIIDDDSQSNSNNQQEDEEVITFDDDDVPPSTQKEDATELEDEYFDLDGF